MKSMSNVDIYTIIRELNEEILDARIDKAYQPTYDTIRIKLRKPGEGRKDIVMQAGVRIHLTDYPQPNPTIPPNFPMLLRKHLSGGRISSIKQHDFDRIVEIKVEKRDSTYTLVVELFSKGNVILLDEEGKIISPFKHKHWHDRDITAHEMYKYPPEKGIVISDTNFDEIKSICMNSDRDIVRTLATNGLGGLYAEEIISYTDINKETLANTLSDDQIEDLNNAIKELFSKIENDPKPQIIKEKQDDDTFKNKDFVPIDLNKYKDFESESFDSFNKTADEFYSKKIVGDIQSEEEKAWAKRIGKYEKRLKMQQDTLDGFYKTIEDTQIKGDLIYAHYSDIDEIIQVMQNARNNYSWQEIAKIIKKSKKDKTNIDLQNIISVDKMGVLTLQFDDINVLVDCKLPIAESAAKYYNKGKKAKRKISGVNTAMENTKAEIKKLQDKKTVAITKLQESQKRREKRKLKWFEKYRWFVSRDGFLVLGGRDAISNEQLVKKHSTNYDIYFHCDIHGAPSTIIQNTSESEIPEDTIYDAACFAGSFSSAWNDGFSSYDVYWVHMDQVSKTPVSGEYLKKGSFVIRGKRNYVRNVPLLIAIGVVNYDDEDLIMAGPVEALKAMCNNYVIIKPGFTKKEAISRKILGIIDVDKKFDLDDIIRCLPSGKCDILDEREYEQKYLRKFNPHLKN